MIKINESKKLNEGYKILTPKEVKDLKNAKYIANEYDEWGDWDDALDKIVHNHIKDKRSIKYFEAESENMFQIDQIDELIYDIIKNGYIII